MRQWNIQVNDTSIMEDFFSTLKQCCFSLFSALLLVTLLHSSSLQFISVLKINMCSLYFIYFLQFRLQFNVVSCSLILGYFISSSKRRHNMSWKLFLWNFFDHGVLCLIFFFSILTLNFCFN